MKTILFVAPSAYTLGGLAVWLDYLLPGLRSKGWRCVLGLVEGPRYHSPKKYLSIHPDEDALAISCSTSTVTGRRKAIQKAIRKVDADIVVSVNIPDAIPAAVELRNSRPDLRTMVACHGIQPDLFEDMNRLASVVDTVACTNRLACRLAEVLGGLPDSRVHYAPCGTPPTLRPGSQRRSLDSPFRIVWVGRLEQDQKRVHDLPGILKILAGENFSFELIIAGTGPEDAAIREEFVSSGVQDEVRFAGHVPLAEMSQVYAQADALLVTSVWETGPIVVWEAMAHSIPVVSSRYVGCGQEQALQHEHTCLQFEIGDTKTAAHLLARLANEPERAESIAKASLQLVSDRYTIEHSVQYWHLALLQTLESAPRSNIGRTLPVETPTGRMDRWLGSAFAEAMRIVLRRKGPDSGAGGEWPHTLTGHSYGDPEFWERAQQIDRGGGKTTG